MKLNNLKIALFSIVMATTFYNCSNENMYDTMDANESANLQGRSIIGTYMQEDQMARPAVNTVFVSSGSKDIFNTTIPSEQGSLFQAMFQSNLEALSPAFANPGDKNALGLDSQTFTSVLATDVLTLSLDGTTTFFDGTNVLTGRALADDVITVELLLIFGGEDFTENPGLSDDHVDANDKPFSASFPYLASPHL